MKDYPSITKYIRDDIYKISSANGFPGNPQTKMIDLKGTPRLNTGGIFRRTQQDCELSRF